MERQITGKTQLLAVIGSPVSHSGSPAMHNYGFELLGLDHVYLAFDIPVEKAGEAIAAAKTFHMKGLNVTMPLKQAVMEHLDELTPAVQLIRACNTIVNEDGKWVGYNTDGIGYVLSLQARGVSVEGKKLVILGAGGAGTAIFVQTALNGAAEVAIFNRPGSSFRRAEETAHLLAARAPGCRVEVCDLTDQVLLRDKIAACDILANATNVGMAPDADGCILEDCDVLREGLVVTDAVYEPRETVLLKEAAKRGCVTVDGKAMLLWQGVEAFRLFTGHDMPVEQVREKFFCDKGEKQDPSV